MLNHPVHSQSLRPLLLGGVALMTLLCVRRAHALGDPSSVEVGGSMGSDTERIACGPDIRVKHATAGVRYEKVFEEPENKPGTGYIIDARAGVGTTTITAVSDADPSGTCPTDTSGAPLNGCNTNSSRLLHSEKAVQHVEGSAQLTAGYDWRTFAISGGIGVFGMGALTDANDGYRQRYWPLPAIDLRVGRREGFSGSFGVGALPVAGLARWYGLYAMAQHRFAEGGEIGLGMMSIAGTLDGRSGFFGKGSFPITNAVALGAFGLIDASHESPVGSLNWTLGGALTVRLEHADE